MTALIRSGLLRALLLWRALPTCWSLPLARGRLQGAASSGGGPLQASPGDRLSDDLDDDMLLGSSNGSTKRATTSSASSAVERWVAEMREARASSFQTVAQILDPRGRSELVRTLAAVCDGFRLDNSSCSRVGRYLGQLSEVQDKVRIRVKHLSKSPAIGHSTAMSVREFGCGLTSFAMGDAVGIYSSDFCRAVGAVDPFATMGKAVIFFVGDRHDRICHPTLIKTRDIHPARQDMSVLLRLNSDRHWGLVSAVPSADQHLETKSSKLVWRGASTGKCDASQPRSRMMLVSKYFYPSDSRIDVGISLVTSDCDAAGHYARESMSMADLLSFKYLLVVDGNDKASGLNWILASNSCPFMVEPETESWLLETSLEPWVHYVPVKEDFSDLSDQLDWAEAHPLEVNHIVNAGKHYVENFRDASLEAKIEGAVLTAYMDRVRITEDEADGDDDLSKC